MSIEGGFGRIDHAAAPVTNFVSVARITDQYFPELDILHMSLCSHGFWTLGAMTGQGRILIVSPQDILPSMRRAAAMVYIPVLLKGKVKIPD
jgi:hypothetical protein